MWKNEIKACSRLPEAWIFNNLSGIYPSDNNGAHGYRQASNKQQTTHLFGLTAPQLQSNALLHRPSPYPPICDYLRSYTAIILLSPTPYRRYWRLSTNASGAGTLAALPSLTQWSQNRSRQNTASKQKGIRLPYRVFFRSQAPTLENSNSTERKYANT